MKKKFFFQLFLVILCSLLSLSLKAQAPTYLLELRNDVQVSSTEYEFDIYLLRTGATAFEYAQGQFGILINSQIINGGTITATIVSGSSDLLSTNQDPTNISFYEPASAIRISPRTPPGAGNGAIISNVSPGTRVCRIRITNTVPFGQYSPNLTWTTTTIWPTQIYAYVSGVNTAVTNHSNHTTNNLNNPVLNSPPTAFTVTGTGSYCEGTSGTLVGLSGSEAGVTYTLYKNSIAQTPTVPGTGTAITFGDQLAGTYTVEGTNMGGTTTMTGSAVVTEIPLPAVPVATAGSGADCSQFTANWNAAANATGYRLDVSPASNFASFVPGYQDLNVGNVTTRTVTGLTAGTTYYYRVRATNNCGPSENSNAITYATSPAAPATPGTITGTAIQCPGLTDQVYSIEEVTDATTYTWTVPTGWSVTSGDGTASITVTTGSTGQDGNITVTAGNSCGTSSPKTLAVSVISAPATPGSITGTETQCPGLTNQAYTIAPVSGATTYTWTVPTGWAITGGQGSTTLTVTTGATGENGSITITAGNSCGTSAASSLPVTVGAGTPATPGIITGLAAQCPGLTGQTYSITAVADATTYTWTVPAGWNITGGQGSTTLTVTTGSTGENGSITVTAGNSCGISAESSLPVTVGAGTPATPGAVSGTNTQCPGLTNQIYSIAPISGATTYTWTIPSGWTISSGQGTISLTVTTGSAGDNGNITVTAGNSCGTSTESLLAVTVNPGTPVAPLAISGSAAGCSQFTTNWEASPDATSYWLDVSTSGTFSSYVTGYHDLNLGDVTSYDVTGLTAGNIYYYRLRAVNSCGISAYSNVISYSTSPAAPATPGSVSGLGTQCPGLSGQTYGIDPVTNATSYTWSVPTGWTITGGNGTPEITVTTGAFGNNGNISVSAVNSCGTSSARLFPVTVSPGTPSAPVALAGSGAACSQITANWNPSANATTYFLDVSTLNSFISYVPGFEDLNVSNVTSYSVTGLSAGTTYYYRVRAGNSCGTSTSSNAVSYSTFPATPATPGTVTGLTTQCPNVTGQVYSISSVPNATVYTWSVPSGWAIEGGQGTESITVTTGATGQNGNISVTAGNSCGTSTARTLSVSVISAPAAPGSISGAAATCPGQAGQTYSISAVPTATSYDWTVPSGWVITSGQGTISITVTSGSPGNNGNITVAAVNSCGTSAASSMAVSVNPAAPGSPGAISGTQSQCPGISGQTYVINPVTNATTYTWNVPAGWTITGGQGTTTLTVTTGLSGENGNITVTAGNSCGTSSPSSLPVTVLSLSTAPAGISVTNDNTCNGTTKTLTVNGGSLGAGATWQWYTGSCGETLIGTGSSISVDPPAGSTTTYFVRASGTCNITSCATGTVVVTPTVGTPSTPIPSATVICQGSSPTSYTTSATDATSYNWSVTGTGNTISGTGTTGTVTWDPSFTGLATISVTANGCGGPSSSVSTTVLVRPTPTATIGGSTTVCQYSASPPVTFTNPQSLPVTITYNINGGTNSVVNVSAGSSSTVAASTASAGPLVYNLVSISYQDSPNCSSSISGSATVTVNPVPTPTIVSSDADNILCAGTSVTFTATGGVNYNFRVSTVTVQNGPLAAYTTSSLTNGQVVDVVVTGANGCLATSSGITNFVNPLPLIFVTKSPTCSTDLSTYSLEVTVGSGIVTSTAGTVTNTSGNIWAISDVPSGTNITVKVTDVNGCESVIAVTAPNCDCPVIQPPVSGGDKSYCESSPIPAINATVSAGETVDWYNSPSNGTPLLAGSLTYTPAAPGVYYAAARNITTNCTSSTRTAISVTMNSLPIPSLTSSDADNSFCTGTSITFTAGGGTNYNFRIGGFSVQNSSSNTFTTNSLSNGQVVDVIVTNSNGCSATSSGITNTVNPLPVPTLTSSDADNSFCSGTSVTFTAGGGTSYIFRIFGTTVQSGTSNTYTTSALTNGQVVDVVVTNSNGCTATSSGIVNTVHELPVATLTSSDADNTFCSGTSITFTASGGTNYNFRVGGSSVQAGSSPTYATDALTNGQVVDIVVTNANGCASTSAQIVNTVYALPTAVIISSDADNKFCVGTSVTFTAGGGSSYNFRVNGTMVQNGPSSSYTTSSLTNGQVVDVIVTNSNGCSTMSSGITNTVYDLPVATLTSSDPDNIICAGTSVTFTAGGGSNYAFRVSGVVVQNGTSPTYTTSSLTNGQVVDVIVTSSYGCTSVSNSITNFVNPLPLIFITTPATCSPDLTTYSVGVTVGSGIVTSTAGTVTNTGPNVWLITDVPSGVSITLMVTDINSCSNSISITAPNCSCPVIQPPVSGGDKSYCQGSPVPAITATVQAGETVDWYDSPVGGNKLKEGSTSYTPAIPGTYYAMTRNTTTGCLSSTRTAITVTMNSLPVPTLSSSDADNVFCAGTSVTFTAGGGTNYDFRIAGTSVQNSTATTFITSLLTNGQVVDVIVTDQNGCVATSPGIVNTVNPLPVPTLVSSDADNKFCSGTTVVFTATGGSDYTFRIGGSTVQSGSTPTFTTSSLTDGQVVDVIVTNSNGCSASSSGITNTVYPLPTPSLVSSDADNRFCAGTSVTFTAGGGTSYNFRVNGSSVQNGASTTYTTTSLTDGQIVDVIVTNTNGCTAVSGGITNTVYSLPAVTLVSSDADDKFCSGTSVTFTAGGGTSYNFRVGGVSVQNGTSATFTTSSLTNGQVVDVVVTNSNGCVSVSSGITNTVYALPSPTLVSSDADNKFCSGTNVTFTATGGTNYNFRVDGSSIQNGASGTYSTSTLTNGKVVDVVVTNSNGCVATSAGITNTVYALPVPTLTSSDTDNTFCQGTSVTFTAGGGTSYNFRVGSTSVQSGTSSTYTTTSLTNGQIVSVIVTNSNGCTATSGGIINIVNPYPVANPGSGGDECDLDFKFSAVPSIGTGTWSKTSGPGTATFTPYANSATATVTVSEYGTYTFTWTEVSNGCSKSSDITVNFYQQPVANAGTGGNNCGPEHYLNAVPSIGTGTWTLTSGPGTAAFTPDSHAPDAKVTVSTYGDYTFTWTEINGTCSNSDAIDISFLEIPAANGGSDGAECDLDFMFSAVLGSGGTGTWNKISGPGNAVFSPDANQPDATVTVDQYGTYTFAWTEVQSACESTDLVSVVFRSLPSVDAGRDTLICFGESVRLDAEGAGTFAWHNIFLLNDTTIRNPVATPIEKTDFIVTLTDQYGCANKDTVVVDVWYDPVAYAGEDTTLHYIFTMKMSGNELELNETGTWSVLPGEGSGVFEDPEDPETNVTGLSEGDNILLWTVDNGVCPPSYDFIIVTVNGLVVPTLITPNMDGKNDYFVLRGIETLGRTELIIFDRRGTQVYKNENYDNKWNGVDYNENPLPDDTYFYTLRSQNGRSMSGYVVIRR